MKIDPQTGLLTGVSYIPSPNCDARPQDLLIDLLVLHGISLPPSTFGGPEIIDFFCNKLDGSQHPFFKEIAELRVSSHVLIRRTGEILQFVPFHKRAWHAGVSQFQGRSQCNDFSIGIELEGADDIAYEKLQYEKLAELVKVMLATYPDITRDKILGHSEIAPDRKTDPGSAFDWAYFHSLLEGN